MLQKSTVTSTNVKKSINSVYKSVLLKKSVVYLTRVLKRLLLMKKFKTHIQEMAAVNAANLDTGFLKRAQKITSFNLRSFDFESLKHKAEIQFLIKL